MKVFYMDELGYSTPSRLQDISYDEDTTGKQVVDNLGGSLAVIETTSTASQPYTAGKRLVYKGKLYKTTQSIAQGGTLLPGTNITPDTIDSELNTISANLLVLNNARTWKEIASFNANGTFNWLRNENIQNYKEFKIDLMLNGIERMTALITSYALITSGNGVRPDIMTVDGRIFCNIIANNTQYTVSSLIGLSDYGAGATFSIFAR